MHYTIKLAAIAVVCLACVECRAQIATTPIVISNCGGEGDTLGYKMEWTVAEFAVQSLGNSQYHFTQGFHQPFLVRPFVSTVGIAETPQATATSLWPNPASNQLNLSFSGLTTHATTVKVFGLDGKLLLTTPIGSGTTTTVISIDALAAGSYLAVICDSHSTPLASHRFIKIL